MTEASRYRPQPEDVLTDAEYWVLEETQHGKLTCKGCGWPLEGAFLFFRSTDPDHPEKIIHVKGVALTCRPCDSFDIYTCPEVDDGSEIF